MIQQRVAPRVGVLFHHHFSFIQLRRTCDNLTFHSFLILALRVDGSDVTSTRLWAKLTSREGGRSPHQQPPSWHLCLLPLLLRDGALLLHRFRWHRRLQVTSRLPTRMPQNLRKRSMSGCARSAVASARSERVDLSRHRRQTCHRSICERS